VDNGGSDFRYIHLV